MRLRFLLGALLFFGPGRWLGIGIDERSDNRVLPDIGDIVDFCDPGQFGQALQHGSQRDDAEQ